MTAENQTPALQPVSLHLLNYHGPGFDSRQRRGFLYFTAYIPAPSPTQPPMQWVCIRGFLLGVNRTRREGDHSPPSTAEVKNAGAKRPLLYTPLWRDA
jgi:hypothetical protein